MPEQPISPLPLPAFHPDLQQRARWLPRGVGRRWLLPLLKYAQPRLMARATTAAAEIPLDGCSVFVYRPADAVAASPRAALLWIHGGGLLFGDARQDEAALCWLVAQLGVVVVSVQYRCAPEHPFPAPLDDCVQAFRWLAAQPDLDPTRLAVGGASAGGGLAAALCQVLRDAGDGVQPCAQLLVFPMLDDRSTERSTAPDALLRIWDRPSNRLGWSAYLRGQDPTAPPLYAVPARTEALGGLPPAWIGVGTLDLFVDEDRAYAARLEAAGVPVQLDVIEGAYHGFDSADPTAPVSQRFREAQRAFLAHHLLPAAP